MLGFAASFELRFLPFSAWNPLRRCAFTIQATRGVSYASVPFVYAPLLIALSLLLKSFFRLLKSPPLPAQTFTAAATHTEWLR
jgi:hypothetical protein